MDPISAVAVLTSLVSFSSSALLLVQNFVRSDETIRRLDLEVTTLRQILQESHDTISNNDSLPSSITTCAHICQSHRMDQQFLHMSVAMAQILSENEGCGLSNDQDPAEKTAISSGGLNNARLAKHRQKLSFVSEVQDLISNDFTRSLFLVIRVANTDRLQTVPVRNKIDTGSAENFVSAELLEKHDIDPATIITIPEERREERKLQTIGGFTFTPTREVWLYWHKPDDMKQRQDLFVVVENDQFDLVIGTKQWEAEMKKSAFFTPRIHQSKEERRAQREAAEAAEAEAEALIKTQLEETERLGFRGRVDTNESLKGQKMRRAKGRLVGAARG
ncbi:hypothetical protein F53441_7672 [Fusarium austroafricanum]|uniref:Fungal N-terminal domain-containing protein n=1 Tax=Fusarium austroafricanum TaxID=2364996 RepID=A0A8H4KEN3_9HYPO|nr:hypothetical protein F53441_7672 [Fusarium austroafricanum]